MVQPRLLLSLACMVSQISFSRGQNDPQALFPEDCCTKKMVGDVGYTQVVGNTDGFDCTGQCVYEEDGKPGSLTCFKSGGPAPLPAKCTESFIDSAYVSFARNSGSMIFNTSIGTYSCSIGSAMAEGESIECSKQVNQQAESALENEKAVFFSSMSPDGKYEWMCFHTTDVGIHCEFEETLKCRFVPPFQQQAATLYVECGVIVDPPNEIGKCQELCNKMNQTECMFWTLSLNQSNPTEETQGHRFHLGPSECGIRNYTPNVLLNNINQNQLTGKWRQANFSAGSVYVFDQTTQKDATACHAYCKSVKECTVWTWQRKPDGMGSVCAINTYTPKRKVIIPMWAGQPQLISGCIPDRLNGLNCTTLPSKC